MIYNKEEILEGLDIKLKELETDSTRVERALYILSNNNQGSSVGRAEAPRLSIAKDGTILIHSYTPKSLVAAWDDLSLEAREDIAEDIWLALCHEYTHGFPWEDGYE